METFVTADTLTIEYLWHMDCTLCALLNTTAEHLMNDSDESIKAGYCNRACHWPHTAECTGDKSMVHPYSHTWAENRGFGLASTHFISSKQKVQSYDC